MYAVLLLQSLLSGLSTLSRYSCHFHVNLAESERIYHSAAATCSMRHICTILLCRRCTKAAKMHRIG